jgi:hypothetical protein
MDSIFQCCHDGHSVINEFFQFHCMDSGLMVLLFKGSCSNLSFNSIAWILFRWIKRYLAPESSFLSIPLHGFSHLVSSAIVEPSYRTFNSIAWIHRETC